MKGYKGFDKDLKCRDFQFEIGDYYRGKPAPEGIKSEYGYKTVRQSELREALD